MSRNIFDNDLKNTKNIIGIYEEEFREYVSTDISDLYNFMMCYIKELSKKDIAVIEETCLNGDINKWNTYVSTLDTATACIYQKLLQKIQTDRRDIVDMIHFCMGTGIISRVFKTKGKSLDMLLEKLKLEKRNVLTKNDDEYRLYKHNPYYYTYSDIYEAVKPFLYEFTEENIEAFVNAITNDNVKGWEIYANKTMNKAVKIAECNRLGGVVDNISNI